MISKWYSISILMFNKIKKSFFIKFELSIQNLPDQIITKLHNNKFKNINIINELQ